MEVEVKRDVVGRSICKKMSMNEKKKIFFKVNDDDSLASVED